MKHLIIENNLVEAVGVPTNITEIAKQLYDKVMSELKPNVGLKSLLKKSINLKGDFQINEYKFNAINLVFDVDNVEEYEFDPNNKPKIVIRGMTHKGTVELGDKFNYISTRKLNKINLAINLAISNEATSQDLIDELTKDRVTIISSLAHELKHAYDESVDPLVRTPGRVDYQIGTQRRFGSIKPLNILLHYMYFAHTTENLVRATELYSALEESGITKKEFYNFITNHKVYTAYKDGANLTYENLRKDLKSMIPQIKETFNDNNIHYPEDISDDEMVDLTLKQFFKTLLNWRGSGMKEFLTQDFMESMFGFSGAKERFFDKYLTKITRFGDDYEKFIKYEINKTRDICLKMTKKLSKLYSLLKPSENESTN